MLSAAAVTTTNPRSCLNLSVAEYQVPQPLSITLTGHRTQFQTIELLNQSKEPK
jgi:hypothetical protein